MKAKGIFSLPKAERMLMMLSTIYPSRPHPIITPMPHVPQLEQKLKQNFPNNCSVISTLHNIVEIFFTKMFT